MNGRRTRTKMSALIVEDNDEKYAIVAGKFDRLNQDRDDLQIKVTRASDCFGAIEKYDREFFDFIILDLKIPLRCNSSNGEDVQFSKEFYDHVLFGEKELPFLIVGLTSIDKSEYETVFSTHPIFNIEEFVAGSDLWFQNITRRIDFVASAKSAVKKLHSNNYDTDVLILVARENNEFVPIRDGIRWVGGIYSENSEVEGRLNSFGRAELPSGKKLDVGVVCLGEMGLSVSAAVCAQLVHMFRPRYFAMLGMCCGFNDDERYKTKLGDVIIARQTANWDEGMYQTDKAASRKDPFFQNDTKERMPPDDFGLELERVFESEWKNIEASLQNHYLLPESRSETSKVDEFNAEANLHFNLLLSGSSVINSGSKIGEIRKRFSTAVGLEMEAHSVYSAMYCVGGVKPKTVVIKGVADHGDGTKTKAIQKVAAIASLRTFEAIVDKLEQ